MDFGLEPYLYADPVFYDHISRRDDPDGRFEATGFPPPQGWQRRERGEWVALGPTDRVLPEQGWKVHVGAHPDNAERITRVVWDYCVDRNLPFKFLRSRQLVLVLNAKYAPRSASGKLVTIYPGDDSELHQVLTELGEKLAGEPAPYILTDLRWGAGPLFVRYGGFAEKFCVGEDGELEPAITGPDGELHPDRRRPVFEVPPWVSLPEFLVEHQDARRTEAGGDLPYRVVRALHFSNGGGVYLADRVTDGVQVVLKEARPWSGLDGYGGDAIRRLRRERWALQQLAGIPGVPEYHDYLTVGEHEFLVQEFVAGEPISGWLARSHPSTIEIDPSPEQVADYTAEALRIHRGLCELVQSLHARGVTFGDLHPGNVLVRPDGSVALVDFELARATDEGEAHGMGAHGFVDSRLVGVARDQHGLACLGLWLFLPLNQVLALAPENGADYLRYLAERFPVPAEFLEQLRPVFDRAEPSSPAAGGARRVVSLGGPTVDWDAARHSMAAAILLSASPGRTDRLFPGGVGQLTDDALGLANGAGGVLWALSEAGCGRHPSHEDWLMDAFSGTDTEQPGLYNGLHGYAYLADYFERPDQAGKLLERAATATAAIRTVDLYGGLAGAGLNLLHFASRNDDARLTDEARAVAQRIAQALDQTDTGEFALPPEGGAGLMRGWSGPALFLTRLAQQTRDGGYLDLAVRAILRDLDGCVSCPNGSLQVDDTDGRALPYLDVGGAGIALVIDELLEHRADDRLEAALPLLVRGCLTEIFVSSGLFQGRAGTLAAVNRAGARLAHDLDLRSGLAHQLGRLDWHAVSYRGHLAFPGDQSLRLSMDLATGVAGVLLSVHCATAERAGFLPSFGARRGWCGRGRARGDEAAAEDQAGNRRP